MTKKQNRNEQDFLSELRILLDRYDVDISVEPDDGVCAAMVQLQFNNPYGMYNFPAITSIDEGDDAHFKVE